MNFDNPKVCPRCNNNWQRENKIIYRKYCDDCNLFYCHFGLLVIRSFLGTDDSLIWQYTIPNCIYGTGTIFGKNTTLPWLPFNITPDKLKTYLLFT